MNRRNALIFFCFVCLIWLAFIYILSSENGITSSNSSNKIMYFIRDVIYKDFDCLDEKLKIAINRRLSLIVRKSAHIFLFMVLFILIFNFLFLLFNYHLSILCSLILVLICAIIDEIHQGFVLGRARSFSDVFIDMIGGFIGYLIVYFVICRRRKNVWYTFTFIWWWI